MTQFGKKFVPGQSATAMTGGNMLRRRTSSLGYEGGWFPAADVYETASAIIVRMDVSGTDPRTLSVIVDDAAVTVSGERDYLPQETVSCIHQLEIERGFFERTLSLPKTVDASGAVAESSNGVLLVTLPLRRSTGKIRITVG